MWLLHEAATKGRRGGPKPPSFHTGGSLTGPVEIVAQIQTHRPITWNDTFIGVSWGKRLMVTELGPGPNRSGFQPPDGQWAFLLCDSKPLPNCVFSGSYR